MASAAKSTSHSLAVDSVVQVKNRDDTISFCERLTFKLPGGSGGRPVFESAGLELGSTAAVVPPD